MPRAVIGRWGRNLAIRVPAEVAKASGPSVGQRAEIAAAGDERVIRKLPVEAMFAGQSPEAGRALYRDVYDWGPDRGREPVEE
jgi:antitoxin MazE